MVWNRRLLAVLALELVLSAAAGKLQTAGVLLAAMNLTDQSVVNIFTECEPDRGDLAEFITATKMTLTGLDSLNSTLKAIMTSALNEHKVASYYQSLNFIVCCNESVCVEETLTQVAILDEQHGIKSLLRHFSRWIFIVGGKKIIPTVPVSLDHVTLIFANPVSYEVDAHASVASTNCLDIHTLVWTSGGGRSWRSSTLHHRALNNTDVMFPNLKHGLNGRLLKIGVMEWLPFCKNASSKTHTAYSQVCKDVLDALSVMLNFSYVFVEPEDKAWGIISESSVSQNITGLMGALVREEVAFLGVPYAYSELRARFISFSYMIMSTTYYVYYKKTRDDESTWLSLIWPLQLPVYACVLAAVAWVVVLRVALLHVTARHEINPDETVTESVWAVITVIFRQACGQLPVTWSSRLLLSALSVFGLIMAAVYVGNLSASMAVSKVIIPFTSLEELAMNDNYGVSLVTGSYMDNVLRHSRDETFQQLFAKVQNGRNGELIRAADEASVIKQRLLSGTHALIEIDYVASDLVPDTKLLARMKEPIISLGLRFPFPKNSPLAPLFSEKLMVLFDDGMLDNWVMKYSNQSEATQQRGHTVQNQQLSLNKLYLLLTICGLCVAVAVLILVAEYVLWRVHVMRNKSVV